MGREAQPTHSRLNPRLEADLPRILAKAERFIRFADVQTAQVGFGVNGNPLHLHGAQGT